MTGCPVHQVEWKLVPAGVSKRTGKAYSAFMVCPVKDCTEKPKLDAQASSSPKSSPTGTFSQGLDGLSAVEAEQQRGRRMNRSNLASAAIQAGLQFNFATMNKWERWVDTGVNPQVLSDEQEDSIQ